MIIFLRYGTTRPPVRALSEILQDTAVFHSSFPFIRFPWLCSIAMRNLKVKVNLSGTYHSVCKKGLRAPQLGLRRGIRRAAACPWELGTGCPRRPPYTIPAPRATGMVWAPRLGGHGGRSGARAGQVGSPAAESFSSSQWGLGKTGKKGKL